MANKINLKITFKNYFNTNFEMCVCFKWIVLLRDLKGKKLKYKQFFCEGWFKMFKIYISIFSKKIHSSIQDVFTCESSTNTPFRFIHAWSFCDVLMIQLTSDPLSLIKDLCVLLTWTIKSFATVQGRFAN